MAKYRIPQPHALRHPETGAWVVPQPGVAFEDNDPMVKAHPWAFVSPEEHAEQSRVGSVPITEVPIEAATRAPGEKRVTKKA